MGFIERIAEAIKPAPEQAEPETKEAAAGIQTEQTAGTENGEREGVPDGAAPAEEKTYSQDEIESIIEERKKAWEAERMNALSKDSQIEELKAELLRRKKGLKRKSHCQIRRSAASAGCC